MHVDRPGVAIAGAGNIAQQYAAELAAATEVELLGVVDLDRTRAQALADEHGVRHYADLDELLADGRVTIVVNLTTHRSPGRAPAATPGWTATRTACTCRRPGTSGGGGRSSRWCGEA